MTAFPEMEKLLVGAARQRHRALPRGPARRIWSICKEIILSPEQFEPKEDIYYKRHIAVDIPSVYGRYSERKFDALGLTFRLENLANVYLERLFDTVNLSFITQATFIRIVRCLKLFTPGPAD